jgi:hypothetical protein
MLIGSLFLHLALRRAIFQAMHTNELQKTDKRQLATDQRKHVIFKINRQSQTHCSHEVGGVKIFVMDISTRQLKEGKKGNSFSIIWCAIFYLSFHITPLNPGCIEISIDFLQADFLFHPAVFRLNNRRQQNLIHQSGHPKIFAARITKIMAPPCTARMRDGYNSLSEKLTDIFILLLQHTRGLMHKG